MLKVYNLMGLGLLITGLAAFGTMMLATTTDPARRGGDAAQRQDADRRSARRLRLALRWVVMLAPLAWCSSCSAPHPVDACRAAQTAFWVFAGADGPVALVDLPGLSPASRSPQTFFVTAVAFARLASGATPPSATSPRWGSFLIMGVIGLIVAMWSTSSCSRRRCSSRSRRSAC